MRLINDVLDMERISSGTATLNQRECELATIAEQAIGEMRGLAEERDVRLVSEVAPLRLYVDADRILQALVNLLSNAIKFSPPGGRVWVLGERRSHTEALVRVRDEGRGIPPDKIDAIFERFSQVDGSDARDQGGSGLGLAICRSIVAHHGGEIWAESELGVGTTLSLTLPLAEHAAPPARAESVADAPAVLVCDDDPEVCARVAGMIEGRGYRALCAGSGPQALALVARERPAAILLDLIMPGMDGWETLAALLARPETSAIPVVILSVLSPERAGADTAGVAEWLTKPVDEERLVDALGRAAAARRGARVLLVEDDHDLAAVLLAGLRKQDLEVHHAAAGRPALELAERIEPDLVVLDVMLPDGDGFGVVEGLRRHDRLRLVPLVVYTGLQLAAAERERLRLGPTAFLAKGDTAPLELVERVMALLDHPPRDGAPP